ncbi:unnamed protein product [Acanthosepion pharaonis]|uniref:DDE-1 domain-containing protein n=1 Tax=Acanthosepion pharaonis TaxID=158019 RepID=A0A812BSX8_ACAPH|nr:unnamed protein product [Sepia pharaonis]
MNEDLFVDYMLHFIEHTRCTKERPVLLILDNVETHITINTIDLARENGVVLLTLPPHTSHRLQPLDRTVYGPFKKAYNAAMDGWIHSHPGRTVTNYDIPTIVSEAQLCAMSQRSIKTGFAATGIYPYNKDIFVDADFASTAVTDRQNPEANADAADLDPIPGPSSGAVGSPPIPRPSSCGMGQQPVSSSCEYVSPSAIYPFPRAEPRKTKGGRKKRATKILTDTAVRDELAAEKAKVKPTKDIKKKLFSQTSQKTTANVTSDDDSDDEDCESMAMNDSDDDDVSDDELIEGDFVVVSVNGKKTTRRYIARVDVIDGDELEGVFLKRIQGRKPMDGRQAFIIDPDSLDKIL